MGIRRLGISNPAANTDTIIFTSENQYLLSVIAANKSASASSIIDVWVEPYLSASASQHAYVVNDLPVDAANTYETFRFAVNQGDVVKVRASTSNISFSAYGLVQYDVNLGLGISSYQPTAPSLATQGMLWVNSSASVIGTTAKPIYVYSGTQWLSTVATGIDTSANYTFTGTVIVPGYQRTVLYQSSAPSSPVIGDLWMDNTVATAPVLKVYNGSSWILSDTSGNYQDSFFLMGA